MRDFFFGGGGGVWEGGRLGMEEPLLLSARSFFLLSAPACSSRGSKIWGGGGGVSTGFELGGQFSGGGWERMGAFHVGRLNGAEKKKIFKCGRG